MLYNITIDFISQYEKPKHIATIEVAGEEYKNHDHEQSFEIQKFVEGLRAIYPDKGFSITVNQVTKKYVELHQSGGSGPEDYYNWPPEKGWKK